MSRRRPKPEPEPEPQPVPDEDLPWPQDGGWYRRDPDTGALIRLDDSTGEPAGEPREATDG